MSIKNTLKKRGRKVKDSAAVSPLKNKEGFLSLKGFVTQNLPGQFFLVQITHDPDGNLIPSNHQFSIRCYISGKIKQNHIHIVMHDTVFIEVPADSAINSETLGRIFFREKNKKDDVVPKI